MTTQKFSFGEFLATHGILQAIFTPVTPISARLSALKDRKHHAYPCAL
ncbi:MAG: hypothetical protein VW866_00955 [Hyphomicrobiales bacterium]